MSSLLSNDFVEEYFRVENNLTTNNQKFYIDREGRLIYTTPFFTTEDLISDTPINLGNKNVSRNVNIIIDSIALISTNPNVNNYLPLSIDLGGGTPTIEFSNVTASTLSDYKIIVEPPINLNTVTNIRYSSPENSCFDANDNVNNIKNVVRSGLDNVTYKYFYLLDQVTIGEETNVQIVDQAGTTTQSNLTPVSYIYGNNYQAVAVTDTLNTTIYNLFGDVLIDTLAGELFLDLFLFTNNLILVTGGVLLTPLIFSYYVKSINNTYLKVNTIFSNQPGVILIGLYRTNKFFTLDVVGNISSTTILPNNEVVISNYISYNFNTVINAFNKLYVGGSNIDRPNISVFTYVDDELIWYFFTDFSNKPIIKRYTLSDNQLLKRYNNTAYLIDNFKIYLFNLDDGSVVIYPSDQLNGLVPRVSYVVNFTDFDLIQAGLSYPFQGLVVSTVWKNQRVLNAVYKVVYNYSERNFPYHLADNFIFNLTLPNQNPMADMEIFKYIVDFRIRYDQAPISKTPPKQYIESEDNRIPTDDMLLCVEECDEGVDEDVPVIGEPPPVNSECKMNGTCDPNTKDKCVKRCKINIGDASRILGYVGDDFNVEDFLNIYSTR